MRCPCPPPRPAEPRLTYLPAAARLSDWSGAIKAVLLPNGRDTLRLCRLSRTRSSDGQPLPAKTHARAGFTSCLPRRSPRSRGGGGGMEGGRRKAGPTWLRQGGRSAGRTHGGGGTWGPRPVEGPGEEAVPLRGRRTAARPAVGALPGRRAECGPPSLRAAGGSRSRQETRGSGAETRRPAPGAPQRAP